MGYSNRRQIYRTAYRSRSKFNGGNDGELFQKIDDMKTTSALLGIIGGLLGIVTGYWIQTVGGINSFFEIDNADTTIVIGKIVIALSMAIII